MTLRHLLLATVFAFSSACHCGDDLVSSTACDLPCYTGPRGTANVGLCKTGWPVCDDAHQFVSCLDDVTPAPELCDGLDNDCNGLVDDASTQTDARLGLACGPETGLCGPGHVTCRYGEATCLGALGPREERCFPVGDWDCNGFDNDIAPALCYDGDYINLTFPNVPCRVGIQTCEHGISVCVGEVLPALESCGAHLDLNCNGILDDVPGKPPTPIDIVVLLDRSGSMAHVDPFIRSKLADLGNAHGGPEFAFSLIDVPGPGFSIESTLALNAANGTDFSIFIRDHDRLNGATELSYDAMAAALTVFGIRYRSGVRRIFFWFGDEEAQTRLGLTQEDILDLFLMYNVTFYGFVDLTYASDYDDLATMTHGALYQIDNPASLDSLDVILQAAIDSCP